MLYATQDPLSPATYLTDHLSLGFCAKSLDCQLNEHLLVMVLEVTKTEIKVLADPVSAKEPLLGMQVAPSHGMFHGEKREREKLSWVPFRRGANPKARTPMPSHQCRIPTHQSGCAQHTVLHTSGLAFPFIWSQLNKTVLEFLEAGMMFL